MKLVIDLPQAKYNTLMNDSTDYRGNIGVIYKAIQNGRPLKAGHWVRVSIDKYSEHAHYWYKCDLCGKQHIGDTNFCPNCGAKMEVANEVSD